MADGKLTVGYANSLLDRVMWKLEKIKTLEGQIKDYNKNSEAARKEESKKELPAGPNIDAVMLWLDEMSKAAMGGLLSNAIWLGDLRTSIHEKKRQGKTTGTTAEDVASVAYKTAQAMWRQRAETLLEVSNEMQGEDVEFEDLDDLDPGTVQ